MTNSSINPNSYLKAFHTDTYLCNGNVFFNKPEDNLIKVSGLFHKNDTDFETQIDLTLPSITKRINLRVFNPQFIYYPSKFVAHYNLVNTVPFGAHTTSPRLYLLDGSEVEVYGFSEIKKIRLMVDDVALNPFLLQIALFK